MKKENSFGAQGNKTRAIGFLVAQELTDQELISVSGAGGDTTWAMGPGGQFYASDVAK